MINITVLDCIKSLENPSILINEKVVYQSLKHSALKFNIKYESKPKH